MGIDRLRHTPSEGSRAFDSASDTDHQVLERVAPPIEEAPQAPHTQIPDLATRDSAQLQKTRESLSRRAFFGVLGGGVLGGATLLGAKETRADTDPEEWERMKNISTLETPNALYRIVYSFHTTVTDSAVLEGTDAVVLEGVIPEDKLNSQGVIDGLKYQLESKNNPAVPSNERQIYLDHNRDMRPQYQDILRKAFNDEVPVYIADLVDTPSHRLSISEDTEVDSTRGVESVAGSVAIGYGLAQIAKKPPRRSVLKAITALFGGGYLGTQLPHILQEAHSVDLQKDPSNTPVSDEHTFDRELYKASEDMNRVIHPETKTLILDIRNTLIAQKAETIARTLEDSLGRKPNIVVIIGAAHKGIEGQLLRTEESRVKEMKSFFGGDFATQANIIEIEKNGDGLRAQFFKDSAFESEGGDS